MRAQKMLTNLAIVCAVVVASTAIMLKVSHAYTTTGYRWSSISYMSVCVNNSYSGDADAWDAALNSWYNTSTPFNYYFTCTSPEFYLNDTYDSNVAWDGLTSYTQVSGNQIIHTDSFINYYYAQNFTAPEESQSVAAHEIGHVFGLNEQQGDDIMNPSTCGGSASRYCYYTIWGPQTDDINGVNSLY